MGERVVRATFCSSAGRSELRPHFPKLRLVETEVPEHPNKNGNISAAYHILRRIPEKMRGTWVGALCSWYHCPLESGGTSPPQGDAAQQLRLTPRMAGVATADPLLLDNSLETSTEKRQKRQEKEEAPNRKTSPTPLPRELERDARGLEKLSGEGWVKKRSGLLALWPSGSDTGLVSALHRHGTSR